MNTQVNLLSDDALDGVSGGGGYVAADTATGPIAGKLPNISPPVWTGPVIISQGYGPVVFNSGPGIFAR